MQIEGRCHCGKIAYEATIDPDAVGICHCTRCETLSGSPDRVAIQAAATDFVLLRGDPKIYIETTDSGTKGAQAFCPDGGTPIYGADAQDSPIYSSRRGAIRQRAALRPRRQIWCRSAPPCSIDISAVKRREGEWYGRR